LLEQAQIDLVHEGCRRQRVPWRFAANLSARHLTELLVDERQQVFDRPAIAGAPTGEPLGALAVSGIVEDHVLSPEPAIAAFHGSHDTPSEGTRARCER
jgi:hypothetical protein